MHAQPTPRPSDARKTRAAVACTRWPRALPPRPPPASAGSPACPSVPQVPKPPARAPAAERASRPSVQLPAPPSVPAGAGARARTRRCRCPRPRCPARRAAPDAPRRALRERCPARAAGGSDLVLLIRARRVGTAAAAGTDRRSAGARAAACSARCATCRAASPRSTAWTGACSCSAPGSAGARRAHAARWPAASAFPSAAWRARSAPA